MKPIEVKSEKCRWDSLNLGEDMLRLDPGEGSVHTAGQFPVWAGGRENPG